MHTMSQIKDESLAPNVGKFKMCQAPIALTNDDVAIKPAQKYD